MKKFLRNMITGILCVSILATNIPASVYAVESGEEMTDVISGSSAIDGEDGGVEPAASKETAGNADNNEEPGNSDSGEETDDARNDAEYGSSDNDEENDDNDNGIDIDNKDDSENGDESDYDADISEGNEEDASEEADDAKSSIQADEADSDVTVIDSGSYSNDEGDKTLSWRITSDGVLTLMGNNNITVLSYSPWAKYEESIKKIVVDVMCEPQTSYIVTGLFENYEYVEEIEFQNYIFGKSGLIFDHCNSLRTIKFGNVSWPEESYTISFDYCYSLESIDFSEQSFKVKSLYEPFYKCNSIKEIDLSGLDTSGVSTANYCFKDLEMLEKINLGNMDLTSATTLSEMFSNCPVLSEINGTITTSANCLNTSSMFSGCSSLKNIDLSNLNTSKCTNMRWMFRGCESLESLEISSLDVSYATDLRYMFADCVSLTSIPSMVVTSSTTNLSYMFNNCSSLTSLDVSSWDVSSATDMSYMFNNCSSLTPLDVSSWDTSSATNLRNMFFYCSSLSFLDVSHWNTSKVTDLGSTFYNCSSLTSLDVSSWDTSSVTNFSNMFSHCSSLTSLDVSSWDTSKVTSISSMFYECSALTYLDLSNFTFNYDLYDIDSIMARCSSLEVLDLGFNGENLSSMGLINNGGYGFENLEKIYLPYNLNVDTTSTFTRLPRYDSDGNENTWYLSDGSIITNFPYFPYIRVTQRNSIPDASEDRLPPASDSGSWGGINWSLESGVLNVSSDAVDGAAIPDLTYNTYSDSPWYKYKDQINKIIIGEGVTYIGDYSFYNQNKVKNIEITEGVTGIGSCAFQKCIVLEEIAIPSSVTQIGTWAFAYDETMKTIAIPEGVTEIGESMFQECKILNNIHLPSTVTKIGFNAFVNCSNLDTIHFRGLRSQWEAIDFHATTERKLEHCIIWFSDETFYQKTLYEGEFGYINSEFPSTTAKYTYSCDLKNFLQSSYSYQHDLTQMSIRVAMAAMGTDDGTGVENIRSLMDDMGFRYSIVSEKPSINFDTPDGDTIGYAIGRKKILSTAGEENTLILVAVRGGGYGNEWAGNFNVGMGTNHAGFEKAANQVKQGLSDFIHEEGIKVDSSVHVWICGYSRAAATSNLLAAKLDDGEIKDIVADNVHAFCFECPQNTTATNVNDPVYSNIVNVVNPIDLVPLVAPNNNFLWKYTRYGQTYLLPAYNNTTKYKTLKESMESCYKSIVNSRKGGFNADYTDVALLQSEQYKNIVNSLTVFITSPEEYTVEIQSDVYKAIYDYFSDKTIPDLGDIFDILWRTVLRVGINSKNPITRSYYEAVIGSTLANIYLTKDNIAYAHYPELCLAWVDSLSETEFKEERSYKKLFVNCPVNVEVYENGTLVGAIDEDVPREIADGVETYIDDNGQKVLILPGDGNYEVKLTSYDEGEVTYTVATFDDTVSTPSQLVSYYEIAVEDASELTGIVSASEISLKNKDGQALTPDIMQSGDEIQLYVLELSSDGAGIAIGEGAYNPGEYVKLMAFPEEDAQFLGWSIDGVIVSTDEEYRILMSGNKTVTAKFTDGLRITGIDQGGYDYTGAAIKPAVEVYDGKTLLKAKTDYVISYSNNTKVADKDSQKAPTITVTGKGNYQGKDTITFTIKPKSIEDEDITVGDIAAVKTNGKAQKPTLSVKYGKKTLSSKNDYTVTCFSDEDCTVPIEPNAPDIYYVMIDGKGNYSGSVKRTFQIASKDSVLTSKLTVVKIQDQTYTGSPIQPAVTVKNGKTELVEGRDYTVSYPDENIDVGVGTVKITGDGINYVGSKTVTFKITGVAVSKAVINNFAASYIYDGKPKQQTGMNLTYTEKGGSPVTLTEDVDYTVQYTKNINVGTATMTISGIGKYTGTKKKTFKITAYDLSADTDKLIKIDYSSSVPYAKGGAKPEVSVTYGGAKLTLDTDYTLSYSNNTSVNDGSNQKKLPTINVKGKGNFKGTNKMSTFIITQQQINASEINSSAVDKVYANKKNAWKSTPVVTDAGKKLSLNKDYKIDSYTYTDKTEIMDASVKPAVSRVRQSGETIQNTDILPAGTDITVTITGTGSYSGSTDFAYRIVTQDIGKLSVVIGDQYYSGSAITLTDDMIHFKLKNTELTDVTYEIDKSTYKNNVNKGTATVMIKGTGNYGKTKTVKYRIKAKGFLWWWRSIFQ